MNGLLQSPSASRRSVPSALKPKLTSVKGNGHATKKHSLQRVVVGKLSCDPSVQRSLRQHFVQKIAANFDPDKIGVVTVNKRADGDLMIIDGQHRVAALVEMGWSDQLVDCNVYENLALHEEAALFVALNTRLNVQLWDNFRIRVEAHDPDALAIYRIAEEVGFHPSNQSTDGTIAAISAMEKIYSGAGFRQIKAKQPDVLRDTLTIARETWGLTKDAANGMVLHGIGLVLLRYRLKVDKARLIDKLKPSPGGPLGLLGRARGLHASRGGTTAQCVAEIVVEIYNKGSRINTLEPWRSR